RGLLFEGAHLGAEDKAAAVEDGAEPLLQLAEERAVLRGRLEERDPRHRRLSLLGGQAAPARGAPAQEQPDRDEHHRRKDGVVDEAEVVVEALVALADRPARSGEPEAE